MNNEEKIVFDALYSKHQKVAISKKEMSLECGLSISTLDRLRRNSLGCGFVREKQGDIFYPLSEVAKYYCQAVIKTA